MGRRWRKIGQLLIRKALAAGQVSRQEGGQSECLIGSCGPLTQARTELGCPKIAPSSRHKFLLGPGECPVGDSNTMEFLTYPVMITSKIIQVNARSLISLVIPELQSTCRLNMITKP